MAKCKHFLEEVEHMNIIYRNICEVFGKPCNPAKCEINRVKNQAIRLHKEEKEKDKMKQSRLF